MVNAQQWLESQKKYNTKEKRKRITYLNIQAERLEGDLDLSDFINLEEINCTSNQITSLGVSRNAKLKGIYCNRNNFTSLGFLKNLPKPEKLIGLHIKNNNLNSTLKDLRDLVNLEQLTVGTDIHSRLKQDPYDYSSQIYGQFDHIYGSLKPLRNMNKLWYLEISNTDIDNGLEYLPDSLKTFWCSATKARPNLLVKKLVDQLEVYGQPNGDHKRNYAHLLELWKQQENQVRLLELFDPGFRG